MVIKCFIFLWVSEKWTIRKFEALKSTKIFFIPNVGAFDHYWFAHFYSISVQMIRPLDWFGKWFRNIAFFGFGNVFLLRRVWYFFSNKESGLTATFNIMVRTFIPCLHLHHCIFGLMMWVVTKLEERKKNLLFSSTAFWNRVGRTNDILLSSTN